MSNLERKFEKFAIKNLTLYLIVGYIIGYVLRLFLGSGIDGYLSLDPIMILKGQVWRLFSWLLLPPSDYSGITGFMFLLLMMYCCYSIGTILERTWGTLKYNLYIIGGILLTIGGAFASLGVLCLTHNHFFTDIESILLYNNILSDNNLWGVYSTFFINMSIYLGFALTYPENIVRLMFFIPVKMKWLGLIDALYFAYYLYNGISYVIKGYTYSKDTIWECYAYYGYGVFLISAVAAAIINILIFWLFNLKCFNPKQAARSAKFKREYNQGVNFANNRASSQSQSFYSQQAPGSSKPKMRGAGITKHKCAVCGQSEQDNPNLEFRFCSKCNGAYEYCQNHLFSHVHKV